MNMISHGLGGSSPSKIIWKYLNEREFSGSDVLIFS